MEPTLARAPGRRASVTVLLVAVALILTGLAAPRAFADPEPTTLTLTATPTVIDWAQPWALAGQLTYSDDDPIPDAPVDLQVSIDGGVNWATLQGETPAPGTSTYTDSIIGTYQKMQYRLFYAGDGVNYDSSYSDPVTVTPRVKLGTPSAPKSVWAGSKFKASGSLKPQMAKGSKTVQIKCYLKKGGSWKLKKTVWAKNANNGSETRYSAKFALSARGTWKLVAYSPKSDLFAKTTSGKKVVKVK